MDNLYSKYRWYVLITFFVTLIANAITIIAPATLIGEISKTLHVDLGIATAASMLPNTFASALAAILGGVIIDKISIVKLYIGLLVLLIVSTLLTLVVAQTVVGLIVIRVLQGIAIGPIMASVTKLAAEWFPSNERPIVTGVQGGGISMGIVIGFVLCPAAFVATHSFQVSLAWMAVPPIIALIMVIIMALGPKPTICNDVVLTEATGESVFKLAIKQPILCHSSTL